MLFNCLPATLAHRLSSAFRLYAIDLLGTGLSGRPPFRVRNREEAERFFVDSLDTWRQEQGLDKMVLMGHSMGGYLSACYALRHPERVQHLILMVGCSWAEEAKQVVCFLEGLVQASTVRMALYLLPAKGHARTLHAVPCGCGRQACRLADPCNSAGPLDVARHAVPVRGLLLQ
jgi:pimeloyl-ACP methyl ester carboxylesterase